MHMPFKFSSAALAGADAILTAQPINCMAKRVLKVCKFGERLVRYKYALTLQQDLQIQRKAGILSDYCLLLQVCALCICICYHL